MQAMIHCRAPEALPKARRSTRRSTLCFALAALTMLTALGFARAQSKISSLKEASDAYAASMNMLKAGDAYSAKAAKALLDDVVDWADKIPEQQNLSVKAHWARGVSQTLMAGQAQAADKDFDEALSRGQGLTASDLNINVTLAEICDEQGQNRQKNLGDPEGARRAFGRGLALLPQSIAPLTTATDRKIRLLTHLGQLQNDAKDFVAAEKTLLVALEVLRGQLKSPNQPQDAVNTEASNYKQLLGGLAFAIQGQGKDYKAYLEKYLAENPLTAPSK